MCGSLRVQDGPLKPCDFGGTTALVALRIGEVRAPLPHTVSAPLLFLHLRAIVVDAALCLCLVSEAVQLLEQHVGGISRWAIARPRWHAAELRACSVGARHPSLVTRVAWPARQVLYVAHAGDSRAVLASDGEALRLTADHKPDRPDECARVWVRPPPQRSLLCATAAPCWACGRGQLLHSNALSFEIALCGMTPGQLFGENDAILVMVKTLKSISQNAQHVL
jgi:hypothetical protein